MRETRIASILHRAQDCLPSDFCHGFNMWFCNNVGWHEISRITAWSWRHTVLHAVLRDAQPGALNVILVAHSISTHPRDQGVVLLIPPDLGLAQRRLCTVVQPLKPRFFQIAVLGPAWFMV